VGAGPVASTDAPTRASFGVVLRRYRERALVSQEQLAERSGLSSRAIRYLESGRTRRPHGSSVRLLADALGLGAGERAAFEAAAKAVGNRTEAAVGGGQPRSDGGQAPADRSSEGQTAGGPMPDRLGRPAQLPADVIDFTGREALTAYLCRLFARGAGRPGPGYRAGAVTVAAVTGPGGVGKTALAIHVAHRLRERFPDGQLWVGLGGAGPSPLDPGEVLDRFLRALGVEGAAVPDGLDERGALYRTLLADRRVLVVLDDAAGEAQVRPLLPGGAGCGVVVTSRVRLAGLAGVVGVGLEVLDEAAALELLGRIAGERRVAAEPDAAEAIVRACGCLPLAVRIAGSRLATRPAWPLARLASRLADEQHRLNELVAGDLEVRASLALSYRALGDDQRLLLCRLAVLDAPDLPAWAAAAVMDREVALLEPLLEALVDAHLLTVSGGPAGAPRYRFHDLVRVFARERALTDDPGQAGHDSLARALGGWLALAEEAKQRLPYGSLDLRRCPAPRWRPADPPGPLVADPLGWFEAERAALLAGIRQAERAGLDALAWGLAAALTGFLSLRSEFAVWRETHELGLAAARRAGDRWGQGVLLRGLGQLHADQNRPAETFDCMQQALAAFRQTGDRRGAASALLTLGASHRAHGRFEQALSCLGEALDDLVACGDRRGEASARFEIANVHVDQGRWDAAEDDLRQAIALFAEHADHFGEAHALRRLGVLHLRQSRPGPAVQCLDRALERFRALGNRLDAAYVLQNLGELALQRGDLAAARRRFTEAMRVWAEFGDDYGRALTLRSLGELSAASAAFDQAERYLEQALAVFRTIRLPLSEARTLSSLGDARAAAGRSAAAESAWRAALALFQQLGAPEAAILAARTT
jgi:tetratricopeptide (TPR) repeat protein/transcriptional regulator with XRE-family HTH domain